MKITEEADKLINGQREKDYGHPKDNFKHIARLWDAYLKNLGQANILPKDVCFLMVLLKMARAMTSSTPVRDHRDSVVDMIGYMGLLERLEEVTLEYTFKHDDVDLFCTKPIKVTFNAPGNVANTIEVGEKK